PSDITWVTLGGERPMLGSKWSIVNVCGPLPIAMPRIPIFKLGGSTEEPLPPKLSTYNPYLILEGLQVGVDNLRHDVHLSPRFVEQMRQQLARLVILHGNVGSMLAAETSELPSGRQFAGGGTIKSRPKPKTEPSDLKPLLASLLIAILNRAKSSKNLTIDVLGRLAVLKFLRLELNAQFGQILERCRMTLKNYEGVRQSKGHEYREAVAAFQVAKRVILRKAGLELFHTLREIEKESLTRMRQSLFGTRSDVEYKLFLNLLVFTEDGRDPYFNAEHYIMLGNFDHDPNRYGNVQRLAAEFLRSLNLREDDENTVNGWLSVPENAYQLVGQGTPDELTHEGRSQWARLEAWVELLDREHVLEHVIASYEVVPLLAEYSPRIHIQQLKNALISREERERVETLIQEHGRLSADSLRNAVSRAANCSGAARTKIAARFFYDFLRYHRDLQRLEVVNEALDSVNLIATEKMRELSSMNGTLYEFLLEEEQKPAEAAVSGHVILKADVRDSTKLTRSLLERGLNPASYFSLNFYEPVNKLLAKYGASKVFL